MSFLQPNILNHKLDLTPIIKNIQNVTYLEGGMPHLGLFTTKFQRNYNAS